MSATPRVSVCVPVYNGRAHIAEALSSVRNQDLHDWTLTVFDNCSDDGTWEHLVHLQEEWADPRIRIVRGERNVGAEGNWNRCLEEARAPYFKLLCADDLLEPTCLSSQVALLEQEEHRGCVATACRRKIIDEHGAVLMEARGLVGMKGVVRSPEAVRRIARSGTNPLGEACCLLLRTQVLADVGRFDARYGYMMDVDYWARVLRHGDLLADERTLASFRVNPGSWSHRVAKRQAADARAFVRSLRDRRRDAVGFADTCLGLAAASAQGIARQAFYRWLALRESRG